MVTGHAPWLTRNTTTFVPPDGRPVFVKWRREGKRFVVDDRVPF
jgi:hypothetical protein